MIQRHIIGTTLLFCAYLLKLYCISLKKISFHNRHDYYHVVNMVSGCAEVNIFLSKDMSWRLLIWKSKLSPNRLRIKGLSYSKNFSQFHRWKSGKILIVIDFLFLKQLNVKTILTRFEQMWFSVWGPVFRTAQRSSRHLIFLPV